MSRLWLYITFACVAIGANIGGQDITLQIYRGPYGVPLSVLVGTGVGLVVKYLLDKRFVFGCTTSGVQEDAVLFTLYAAMGLITTSIFWGVELGFELFFRSDHMRYVGGIIGLTIGYAVKYLLDRRFVFGARRPAGAPGEPTPAPALELTR